MPDQEFLLSFAVDIDEAGAGRLQSLLEGNRALTDALAQAFSGARTGLTALLAETAAALPNLRTFATVQAETADAAERSARAAGALTSAFSALGRVPPAGSLTLPTVLPSGDRETDRRGSELASVLQAISGSLSRLSGTVGSEGGPGYAPAAASREAAFPVALDFSRATPALEAFMRSASARFRLTADAGQIFSAASGALSAARSLFASSPLQLKVTPETQGPGQGTGTGTGTAHGTEPKQPQAARQAAAPTQPQAPTRTAARTADATPLPAAAASTLSDLLTRQLSALLTTPTSSAHAAPAPPDPFPNLSLLPSRPFEAAAATIRTAPSPSDPLPSAPLTDFSLLTPRTAVPTPPARAAQTPPTINCPVNITVNAAGSDPEAIGRAVYDTAERYLLRTLEQVF